MPASVLPPPSSRHAALARVLVVDDSVSARRQIRDALCPAGIQVVEASEGREALWKAKSETFGLVITDVHMPTMDGITLVRELRQMPGYDAVPILVLTSDISKERFAEGKTAGANAWLVKPPKSDALLKAVQQALFRGR